MEISDITLVRLTRDAEVELDDDPRGEFREVVQEQIRQRRYEPVMRLEFGPGADAAFKEMLRGRFELSPADMYDMPEEVDYTTLFELSGLPIPALRDPAWTPLWPPSLRRRSGRDICRDSRRRHCSCIILTKASTPASSTSSAPRPTTHSTVSIKMTAYRVGDDTPSSSR